MKIKVLEDLCIGCGFCISSYPELFRLENDIPVPNENVNYDEDVEDIIGGCSASAIVLDEE